MSIVASRARRARAPRAPATPNHEPQTPALEPPDPYGMRLALSQTLHHTPSLDPWAACSAPAPSGMSSGQTQGLIARPSDLSAPQTARYEKISVLGQGGMGRVWLGWDTVLGRNVAIKEPGPDPLATRYLEREAAISAKLDHPHIVSIFDLYHEGPDQRRFVMALVPGRSLAQWLSLRPERTARQTSLRHLLEVCEAIGHAHARQIIHRDLSPHNVLITQDGSARVIDWGLAADLSRDPEPTGCVGTPGYIAPEQALGLPASPASDVWSLGALLHLVLLDSPPAAPHGPDAPGLDPELEAIMRHALRDDPAQRYEDAAALAADLRRWFEGQMPQVYNASTWRLARRFVLAHRAETAITLTAAISLLGSLVWGAQRAQTQADRALAAESRALHEVDRSREALARLYATQARYAYKSGDWVEAERLVLSSLRAYPNPAARGLMAALLATPTAQLVQAQRWPDCGIAWYPSPHGPWRLCRHSGDELVMWRGDAIAWRKTLTFWDVRFDEDRVYVLDGPQQLHTLDLHTGQTLDVQTDRGRFVRAWSAPVYQTTGHDALTPGWPRSPCTRFAVSVAYDGHDHWVLCAQRELWRLPPRGPAQPLTIHKQRQIMAIAATDGSVWAGGESGMLVRVDQPELGEPLGEPIHLIEAMPGRPELLVVQGSRGAVRLFDVRRRAWALSLPRADRVWTDDRGHLWTLRAGLARQWRIPWPIIPQQHRTDAGISVLTAWPRGQGVIAGDGDAGLHLLDYQTGQTQQLLVPHSTHAVKAIAYDPTQDLYHVGAAGGEHIHRVIPGPATPDDDASSHGLGSQDDPRNAQRDAQKDAQGLGWRLEQPSFLGITAPKRMSFFANGLALLSSYSGSVYLADPASGQLIPRHEHGPQETALDLTHSPDRRLAIFSSTRGVWAMHQGHQQVQLHVQGQPARAQAVAIADDGLAALGQRASITLVDTSAGPDAAPRATWTTPSYVMRLVWLRDGVLLAAGCGDGATRVYDRSGRLVLEAQTHDERVSALDRSPEGRWLISGSWDAHLHRLDLEALTLDLATLEARFLARHGEPHLTPEETPP